MGIIIDFYLETFYDAKRVPIVEVFMFDPQVSVLFRRTIENVTFCSWTHASMQIRNLCLTPTELTLFSPRVLKFDEM